jgi:hypothetical protein
VPPRFTLALLAGLLASRPASASLSSYSVGTIPVAALPGLLEFPLSGDFRGQVGMVLLSQGTFDDGSPFAHLSQVSPSAWLHYDGFENLRLSLAFQEFWSLGVSEVGIPAGHEERFVARARLQQPRGTSALYQMFQFDLRSFDDPTGKHQFVFRPRFRVGVGFNLDAARIHSTTLYQEVALRFADDSYTTRKFDFYRGVFGYTWTTRRGLFVTLALVGQVSLNPAGTALTFLYGPVLSLSYRIAPNVKVPEAPPEPPEVEPQ